MGGDAITTAIRLTRASRSAISDCATKKRITKCDSVNNFQYLLSSFFSGLNNAYTGS